MGDRIRTLDVLGEAPSFRDLLLLPPLVKSLADAGYVRPSPVQQAAIPLARLGLDMIIQAKAGTGKTLVFAAAMVELIDRKATFPQALVLAPTREVALQASDVITEIAGDSPLSVATLIGGLPTAEDERILRRRCHVVVGTPGRILALMQRGSLVTQGIGMLVLDEADKLLGSDFWNDVSLVIEAVPPARQILALSATYSPLSLEHLRALMRRPQEIMLCSESTALIGVTHYYYDITAARSKTSAVSAGKSDAYALKRMALLELLSSISFHQAIVFCNSKATAEVLSDELIAAGHAAACLSSDKDQLQRIEVLNSLRSYGLRVVVATDVAARGVDLDRVNLVVNFDLPAVHATLMHRVGRAGRFGTHGTAISLVQGSAKQGELQKAVEEAGGGEVLPLLHPIPVGWSAAQPLPLEHQQRTESSQKDVVSLEQEENTKGESKAVAACGALISNEKLNIDTENNIVPQQEENSEEPSTSPPPPPPPPGKATAAITGAAVVAAAGGITAGATILKSHSRDKISKGYSDEEGGDDMDEILGSSLWPEESHESFHLSKLRLSSYTQKAASGLHHGAYSHQHHRSLSFGVSSVGVASISTPASTRDGSPTKSMNGDGDITEILESTLWGDDSGPLPIPKQWPLQLYELSPAMRESSPIEGLALQNESTEVVETSNGLKSISDVTAAVALAPPTPSIVALPDATNAAGAPDVPSQSHYEYIIASLKLDMQRTEEAQNQSSELLERAFSQPEGQKSAVDNIVDNRDTTNLNTVVPLAVAGGSVIAAGAVAAGATTRHRRPLGSAQATAYTQQLAEGELESECTLAEEAAMLERMAEQDGEEHYFRVGEGDGDLELNSDAHVAEMYNGEISNAAQTEELWNIYWWQHYQQYGYWPGGTPTIATAATDTTIDKSSKKGTPSGIVGAVEPSMAVPVGGGIGIVPSGNAPIPGALDVNGAGTHDAIVVGGWSPSSGHAPDIGAVSAACADQGGYVKVPAQILKRYLELEWQDWQRRFFGGVSI